MVGELASENSIESDSDDDAADDRHAIQVLRLPVRIERGEKEQTGEASGDGAREDFRDHPDAALGTAMSLCQMAMA